MPLADSSVMSDTALAPGDNDLTMHQAKASALIGLFRVPISQMLPHPKQRLINAKWVNMLKDDFKDGVDRASHPIGVILVQEEVPDELTIVPNPIPASQQPQELPAGLQVYIFDGQHRVEAWSLLAGPNDQYWFANVYQRCKHRTVPSAGC